MTKLEELKAICGAADDAAREADAAYDAALDAAYAAWDAYEVELKKQGEEKNG